MRVITVRNVNDGLSEALWWLKVAGVRSTSRNGDVLVSPVPVVTCYQHPNERVLFSAVRDANPFFHHMEALWMLGGANDVAFPARFAKQIAEYSDDGVTLHGAYGHRWRRHFGFDQLTTLIELLTNEPTTRRAVLQMWDGATDTRIAMAGGKDVPCNTAAYFSVCNGALDMTVTCRSNDAVWGCYGANAVHFSILQQFVAEACGLRVGIYYQFSNNLHIYCDRPDVKRLYDGVDVRYLSVNAYASGEVCASRLIAHGETWIDFLSDVDALLAGSVEFRTAYFNGVVLPMLNAHTAYKAGDVDLAISHATHITASDWRVACRTWLMRRWLK